MRLVDAKEQIKKALDADDFEEVIRLVKSCKEFKKKKHHKVTVVTDPISYEVAKEKLLERGLDSEGMKSVIFDNYDKDIHTLLLYIPQ